MEHRSPYTGVFWVDENQLSPELQEALNLPSWELNYTFTEAIVEKTIQNVGWHHYPTVADTFYDPWQDKTIRNESGFIEVVTTQTMFLVAKLPLRVKWYFVGIVGHWSDYYLAFYPRIASKDEKSIHTEEGPFNLSYYFKGFEKALIDILELPYLFRPGAEDIIRVPDVDRRLSDRFMLKSEANEIYEKNINSPDASVVVALLRNRR